MAIFKVRNEKGEWVEVPAIVGPQGPAGPSQIYDGIDSELTDWALSAKQGKVLHDAINSIWNKIYPVGSIYMSIVESDPSTLFGGTWERIEGQFLIGCNSTYPNGTTGGTTNTTLAVANLPGHTHAFGATSGTQSANHTHSGTTANNNVGHTHWVGANTGWHSHDHTHWASTTSNGAHQHAMWGSQSFASGTTNGWRCVKSGDSSYADYNSWTSVDSSGAHTHTLTTGGVSSNHYHWFEATSGGQSANHTHTFSTGNNSANHTHWVEGTTGSTGSATSFTNLPPYLSVYIWKRVA